MLDTFFAVDTGAVIGVLPATATLSQTALAAHPFLWALDAYLFAGPDAHRATEDYAQAKGVVTLDVYVYKIESTVEGVMSLTRVL